MNNQITYTYPGMVRTLNKMGYMFEDLTEYDEEFIQFSEESKGPVLEIGVAYGIVALNVAAKKIKIVANDLEPKHLDHLFKKASIEQRQFITSLPGHFPHGVNFSEGSFSAILASNMFHFLSGEDITQGIKKIFHWLKPGGKVYIIAGTPYAYHWHEFISLFEKRIKEGIAWPGYVDDLSIFKHNHRLGDLPNFMHFFTPTLLSSSFEKYGFLTEKKGFYARSKWPADLQLDGRESAGLIAYKPLMSTGSAM